MADFKLTIKTREKLKTGLRADRETGNIPAVIYGPNRDSTPVYVNEKEFYNVFEKAEHTHSVMLVVNGKESKAPVIIREVQRNALGNKLLHISLFELDMNKRVVVEVPVHFKGSAPAEKNNIGILITPISQLTVRCLPKDIPDEIVVDINDLAEIGDVHKISGITLPKGVEWTSEVEPTDSLAYIVPPQKEEDIEAAAGIGEEAEEEEGEEVEGEEGAEGEEGEETAEGDEESGGEEEQGGDEKRRKE